MHKAKIHGYINSYYIEKKRTVNSRDLEPLLSNMQANSIRSKLITYDLIITSEADKGIYPLTLKGLQFKSFADEDLQADHQKRMKI